MHCFASNLLVTNRVSNEITWNSFLSGEKKKRGKEIRVVVFFLTNHKSIFCKAEAAAGKLQSPPPKKKNQWKDLYLFHFEEKKRFNRLLDCCLTPIGRQLAHWLNPALGKSIGLREHRKIHWFKSTWQDSLHYLIPYHVEQRSRCIASRYVWNRCSLMWSVFSPELIYSLPLFQCINSQGCSFGSKVWVPMCYMVSFWFVMPDTLFWGNEQKRRGVGSRFLPACFAVGWCCDAEKKTLHHKRFLPPPLHVRIILQCALPWISNRWINFQTDPIKKH